MVHRGTHLEIQQDTTDDTRFSLWDTFEQHTHYLHFEQERTINLAPFCMTRRYFPFGS